jgi:hypothetical protein
MSEIRNFNESLVLGTTYWKAEGAFQPVPPQHDWGNNGIFQRVGNGRQTDGRCGQTLGLKGCLNVDLHAHVSLDGVNHTGNVFIKKVIHSCDKPECPVCFKRGWAVREASAIERRIKEASKRFGVAEHIICSVSKTDYGLSYAEMKAKALNELRNRGVLGGVLIFHAERYCNRQESIEKGKPFGWYISFHFHVIGFIDGGYAQCAIVLKILQFVWRVMALKVELDGSTIKKEVKMVLAVRVGLLPLRVHVRLFTALLGIS